jgi:hypothetical protein
MTDLYATLTSIGERVMEGLSIDDVPTFMEEIRGNYSLHGYIDAYNKMAMNEILMHHRSSRVFEMIDDSYNMTMDLYKSIRFNFGLLVQEKSLMEVLGNDQKYSG